MGRTKVLILGWDGASWNIVDELISRGLLPNLSRLLGSGWRAPLNSTTPPMTLPSWSSIITGCTPGQHGIFDFVVKDPDRWHLQFTNSSHRGVPTIHELLSQRGGRVASIAVPTTWPPTAVNGVVVSGFDSPVSTGIDGSFCWPESLYKELISRFGGLNFADFGESNITRAWQQQAVELLKQEVKRKTSIAEWLMAKEDWDLFMMVFGESDTASHHFWMYYDEKSPRHPSTTESWQREAIPEVYAALDRSLGRLMERIDVELVCLCSDHGFGGASNHAIYLNRFLEHHGFLSYHRDERVAGLRSGGGFWDRIRSEAVNRLPHRLQGRVFRKVPSRIKNHMESQSRFGNIDFSKTQAVSDELNYAATIRLNTAKVSSATVPELSQKLLDWRVDGHSPVSKVETREELYTGPYVARSPEIILTLSEREGYTYTVLPSLRTQPGTTWRILEPAERIGGKGLGMNGTHRQHGVLCFYGANITTGLGTADVADVSPTICAALGESIPDYMDGSVLSSVFEQAPQLNRVAYSPPSSAPTQGNKAEHDAIKKRLEGLGYL